MTGPRPTAAAQAPLPVRELPRRARAAQRVRRAVAEAGGYWRLAWSLRKYLRTRITLEEAQASVRQRIAHREDNFLAMVERDIFGRASSPYLPLFKLAGCELPDLRRMVRTQGLEQTLRRLREAGVYVTYEEFRGRTPIVRDGRVFPVSPQVFDHPSARHDLTGHSGGTTGRAIPVPISLDRIASEANAFLVAFAAHGLVDVPMVFWRGTLPDTTGISNILRAARFGSFPVRWFTPIVSRDVHPQRTRRLATEFFVLAGRMWGAPIPWPEPLRLDQAAVLARCARDLLDRHGACLIRSPVSLALRVSLAAQEEGIDLTGAAFLSGGEPPTPAKVAEIRRCGARYIPNYAFTEGGMVGVGCARPTDDEDLHLFTDAFALIQHQRPTPVTHTPVDAFYFTTLLPTASKLMLNVESDDFGISEHRACGCPMEACGMTQHLRGIRSFSKLTTEGEAILGSDILRILEEVLPARFGGTPQDYQLLEEEDGAGFTRLSLIVSPRVPLTDERSVVETVLNALPDRGARSVWGQAGTLRVKRMEPIWTARGKLMPLHLSRRPGAR